MVAVDPVALLAAPFKLANSSLKTGRIGFEFFLATTNFLLDWSATTGTKHDAVDDPRFWNSSLRISIFTSTKMAYFEIMIVINHRFLYNILWPYVSWYEIVVCVCRLVIGL